MLSKMNYGLFVKEDDWRAWLGFMHFTYCYWASFVLPARSPPTFAGDLVPINATSSSAEIHILDPLICCAFNPSIQCMHLAGRRGISTDGEACREDASCFCYYKRILSSPHWT